MQDEWNVARPDVELGIRGLPSSGGPVRTFADASSIEVTGSRSPSAPAGRRPRVGPAPGSSFSVNASSTVCFSSGSVDRRRGAEHDDGAIVDRMLEDGACEDDAVEQCHGHARRDPLAERREPCGSRTSRGRTGGRRSWRAMSGSQTAALVLEAEMTDESSVEDRVDRRAVVVHQVIDSLRRAVGLDRAPERCAIGRGVPRVRSSIAPDTTSPEPEDVGPRASDSGRSEARRRRRSGRRA